MRGMREKRKAYIGQDVYIGRPGLLPDDTRPQTYQNTVLIREKLSSVEYSKYGTKIANEIELIR